MAQHNLGTVVSFEFFRTISKKRFWVGTLAVPFIMAVVFGLLFVSNSAADVAAEAQTSSEFTIAYTDDSGLITPELAAPFKAQKAVSDEAGIEAARSGTVAAFFDFPADPTKQTVKVYGEDQGLFENNKYSAVAQAMLTTAVNAKIGSPELSALAAKDATIDVKTYKDGVESGGFMSAVPPLFYVVIFYGLIILLAGQDRVRPGRPGAGPGRGDTTTMSLRTCRRSFQRSCVACCGGSSERGAVRLETARGADRETRRGLVLEYFPQKQAGQVRGLTYIGPRPR